MMFASALKAVATLALFARAAIASAPLHLLAIPPAGISQCGQITFTWTGGVTPFSLFLLHSDSESPSIGPAVKVFPLLLSRVYDWKVNLPAGTQFRVQLQSAANETGVAQTVYSDPYTILSSSDNSCINTAVYENPISTRPIPPKPTLTMVPAHASSHSDPIHIVLGVLGGLVFLMLIALFVLCRARRKARADPEMNQVVAGKQIVDDDDLDIKKPLPTYAK